MFCTVKSEAGVENQRSGREGTDGSISKNGPSRDERNATTILMRSTWSVIYRRVIQCCKDQIKNVVSRATGECRTREDGR